MCFRYTPWTLPFAHTAAALYRSRSRRGKPSTATARPVRDATFSMLSWACATNAGRNRRSSGGYPVIASSGNATRSQASASARSYVSRMRAALPSRSPTTRFSCARATRSRGTPQGYGRGVDAGRVSAGEARHGDDGDRDRGACGHNVVRGGSRRLGRRWRGAPDGVGLECDRDFAVPASHTGRERRARRAGARTPSAPAAAVREVGPGAASATAADRAAATTTATLALAGTGVIVPPVPAEAGATGSAVRAAGTTGAAGAAVPSGEATGRAGRDARAVRPGGTAETAVTLLGDLSAGPAATATARDEQDRGIAANVRSSAPAATGKACRGTDSCAACPAAVEAARARGSRQRAAGTGPALTAHDHLEGFARRHGQRAGRLTAQASLTANRVVEVTITALGAERVDGDLAHVLRHDERLCATGEGEGLRGRLRGRSAGARDRQGAGREETGAHRNGEPGSPHRPSPSAHERCRTLVM